MAHLNFKSTINVTSFSSILYYSNSEYWTQKHAQSGNIHSIILDIYVEKAEHLKLSFLFLLHKLDKNITLSPPLH